MKDFNALQREKGSEAVREALDAAKEFQVGVWAAPLLSAS